MQMHSVETSAGTAICAAPSRIACVQVVPFFEIALDVLDGDGGVVHQDADGQRQAAERHDVDGLAEQLSTMIEVRIESGMETAMISVLRQLPRKSRIIKPVRPAAMTASRTTPLMAARTKIDWSPSGSIFSSGGSGRRRRAAAGRGCP